MLEDAAGAGVWESGVYAPDTLLDVVYGSLYDVNVHAGSGMDELYLRFRKFAGQSCYASLVV